MNRLKLLAAVALLGIPLAACEEQTPPPPVGSIAGTVTIEGTGIDGVSVNLSNGNSTTTSGGGAYRFDNVEGGAYTVTISGYPSDATFDATSAAATISSAGQSATVNFTGAYIRTASVMGSVTVEKQGLSGVTVTLSGVSNATTTTDGSGQYAFTGLRMGNYSVEISGFDSDEVGFSATASTVSVDVGGTGIVSFDGTYLRTASISGQVSVEGEGLAGVTVSLTGGPGALSDTRTTDASGQYSFAELRAGDYQVGISGYNTKDYEFEVTSQSVTVALGEPANVPFEGTLLRTAGISGRVTVAGDEAQEGVTVTLSGGDLEADMTAETDDAGVYAFAGLAAGAYTVAISGYDAEAYVFDTTSKDVTVEDDEAAIVNFNGAHATTASISGTLYVDEGTNNDMMDEGETPFAMEGVSVPVTLVGPGVHDITPGFTNEMGQYMFPALRAGAYQVVVQIPAEMAAMMPDFAYGGPTEGYSIPLAVGQEATQDIPVDITHQTVNFAATLRSGEDAGAPIPDATVTLYRDMDGEFKIADKATGDDGMAEIRFARTRGEDGNAVTTVYASVETDDYDVADGMETVEFNAQAPESAAANEGDILNLTADVSFAGATITTDAGGGDALKGWAVSVMTGEGDDAEALEGDDVAEALDDDGMYEFMRTVAADDLPVTYTFALAEDQDDKLDRGETVEADEPLEYTHDGLSLKGTMDLGTLEAKYTTQTLKVYVHHEKDQVFGYTGNILEGDTRASGKVEVTVRYIDADGRSRAFTKKEWDAAKKTSDKDGVVTFASLPYDKKIIVQAKDTAANIMVLNSGGHSDELATYHHLEANGVMGGAFGDMGGVSHTVSLCPLQKTDPTDQNFGECASFAFVNTWAVTGSVTKKVIAKSGEGFGAVKTSGDAGTTVSVDPVEGKNLAGAAKSYTAAEKDNSKTKDIDETTNFNHGRMAAGVYKVGVPAGWVASTGKEFHLTGDTDIVVTPSTATVYGSVTIEGGESAGFPAVGVTVTINEVEGTTDSQGRYIITDIVPLRKQAFVSASKDGFKNMKADSLAIAANNPTPYNFKVTGSDKTATVNGTVKTAEGTPIAGVSIMAGGKAPINAATKGANKGKLVTDDDGAFSAVVPAVAAGKTVSMSASKKGYSFSPASYPVSAIDGSTTSGIAFTGHMFATISGTVRAPGGGAMEDVVVDAVKGAGTADSTIVASDTTGSTGYFSLGVAFGDYTIRAVKEDHTFKYPRPQVVNVGPGQPVDFGRIVAQTRMPFNVSAKWTKTDTLTVTWGTGVDPADTTGLVYAVQGKDVGGSWADIASNVANGVNKAVIESLTVPDSIRVAPTFSSGDSPTSDVVTPDALAPKATITTKADSVRGVDTTTDPDTDSLSLAWTAMTNAETQQRVIVEAEVVVDNDTTKYEFNLSYTAPDDTTLNDDPRGWAIDLPAAASTVNWRLASGTQSFDVTGAALRRALRVWVEVRQTGDDKWIRSAPVTVPELK